MVLEASGVFTNKTRTCRWPEVKTFVRGNCSELGLAALRDHTHHRFRPSLHSIGPLCGEAIPLYDLGAMGIEPTIRDITCAWWDGEPVRTTKPTSFAVTVEIGDGDKTGCDLFNLSICNPAFLSDRNAFEWEWQDQMLVLATLSLASVKTIIEEKIGSEGPYESWPEFAIQMAPYMRWEFAGITYPPN